MIILDPVTTSDVSFTGGGGSYYDAAGVLQTAPANTLRVTYDPSDLTAPPYALVEGEATNLLLDSEQLAQNATVWGVTRATTVSNVVAGPDGLVGMDKIVCDATGATNHYIRSNGIVVDPDMDHTCSVFFKAAELPAIELRFYDTATAAHGFSVVFNAASGTVPGENALGSGVLIASGIIPLPNGIFRAWATGRTASGIASVRMQVSLVGPNNSSSITDPTETLGVYVWGAMLNKGALVSYIKTEAAAVTRAADVIGSTGTVLASNVVENDAAVRLTTAVYAFDDQAMENHLIYASNVGARAAITMTIAAPCVVTWTANGLAADTPISFTTTGALPTGLVAGTVYYVKAPLANTFNVSATPGGAAIATTGVQSGVHTATASLNLNKAVSDTTYWRLIGATNQRKMVDAYNNTKTENADAIILVMTPRQISQGLYLGGLDANEVSVVVQDATEGVVYSETQSLVISDSGSSFFNWFFKRIRRKTYFVTTLLPVYANATVTLTISKPGGTAKCGMFCIGPLVDVGLSEFGLATEIKDYSSTTFKFDGTSESVVRGYAKRMSLDVEIDNELTDSVQEQLADFRQKPVVWLGAIMFGSAIVYGKYSSFKVVLANALKSKMALQVEGMV